MNLANRLNNIQEYYFSNKLREIDQLKKNGVDVINLGIGNPDFPPSKEVIETLNIESKIPSNHGYQGYKGIEELRNAYAQWYQKYFNVNSICIYNNSYFSYWIKFKKLFWKILLLWFCNLYIFLYFSEYVNGSWYASYSRVPPSYNVIWRLFNDGYNVWFRRCHVL